MVELRRASVIFAVCSFLIYSDGCMSNVVIPTAISTPPPPASASPSTLSAELNATSVFEGASIIHYWPLPINNNGIPGQTTAQVLARFKSDVVGQGYARVIILCGTNDILQNTPNLTTEVAANLKAMGQIATAAGIQVVLSELPPETWNGGRPERHCRRSECLDRSIGTRSGISCGRLLYPNVWASGVLPGWHSSER